MHWLWLPQAHCREVLTSAHSKGRPPWWFSGKESSCQCRRPKFDPWARKIPRRKWQPTPVFLPGKSHGQRSLAGSSPWTRKESDTTKQQQPPLVGDLGDLLEPLVTSQPGGQDQVGLVLPAQSPDAPCLCRQRLTRPLWGRPHSVLPQGWCPALQATSTC